MQWLRSMESGIMQAIHLEDMHMLSQLVFESDLKDGMIAVPDRYRLVVPAQTRVRVFVRLFSTDDPVDAPTARVPEAVSELRGILKGKGFDGADKKSMRAFFHENNLG
jgi:hypothetical protein